MIWIGTELCVSGDGGTWRDSDGKQRGWKIQ